MENKKYTYRNTFWIFCCLFLFNSISFYAQNSATENVKFKLGSTFGDREVYQFDVETSGSINVTANWTGKAGRLSLILNGPGQVGFYARKDGVSPLKINFEVTPELLAKGTNWTVSIVNFEENAGAAGNIILEYPNKINRKDLTERQIRPDQEVIVEGKPTDVENDEPGNVESSQENGIIRSILDDGTVELRYPDGTIKRITQGGTTTIHPDGTSTTLMFIEIPETTPPELPTDERIITYLEWQIDSLLELIGKILNYDEESIDNFLRHESEIAQSIYQKMYIRTSFINRLLDH